MANETSSEAQSFLRDGSGPWADLALTLPIFIGYHLGVIFLPVRNAADLVTRELVALANNSLVTYGGLTLGIGAVFATVLVVLGRGHALRWQRFLYVALEGVLYAIAMRLIAGYVVGRMPLVAAPFGDTVTGFVMSLGAGLYEEIAFRVVLYGFGVKLAVLLFSGSPGKNRWLISLGWALVAAMVFSAWHYVGELGEAFELRSFVFRTVCGLVFTAIYVFRGFAPAVWTHTLYDIWVLCL